MDTGVSVYSIALRLRLRLRLRLGRVAHCDLQPHTTRSRSSRDSTVESTRRPNEDDTDTDNDEERAAVPSKRHDRRSRKHRHSRQSYRYDRLQDQEARLNV